MSHKEKIALLNDKARKGWLPGSSKMLATRVVAALPDEALAVLRRAVAEFDSFTEDDDPYGEHDFGTVELDGTSKSRAVCALGPLVASASRSLVRARHEPAFLSFFRRRLGRHDLSSPPYRLVRSSESTLQGRCKPRVQASSRPPPRRICGEGSDGLLAAIRNCFGPWCWGP
jgi:hypothetical protein